MKEGFGILKKKLEKDLGQAAVILNVHAVI